MRFFMVINCSCSTNMCARQLSFNFSSMVWGGGMAPWPPFGSAPGYATTIIRLHRSTTYVDAVYCYRPSSVVCRSVCHLVSPAKTAKAIEMPFASRTRVGPGEHLLHIVDRFEAIIVLYCIELYSI